MEKRYIFTVTAGRSGQITLSDVLIRLTTGCFTLFEGPRPKLHFDGLLGVFENRVRRKFFETHELMGRGEVLRAFENGDEAFIDAIIAKRLKMIERLDAETYIDVSKYFARGLHSGFGRAIDKFSLIFLVRDPVANMRSFLNRNKDFQLDNNMPDAASNILRLDSRGMSKDELYLWAWCEMALRYREMLESSKVDKAVVIRTEEIDDTQKMTGHLKALGIAHEPLSSMPRLNTNVGHGLPETKVGKGDVETFNRFLARVPSNLLQRIDYLKNYTPKI